MLGVPDPHPLQQPRRLRDLPALSRLRRPEETHTYALRASFFVLCLFPAFHQHGAPRGIRTPTPFGPWILSPGRLPFRHRGLDIAHYGWCPGRESNPHAFRPVDFESRSSAIPTPGLRFANQDDFAFHAITRAFHIVPTRYTTE